MFLIHNLLNMTDISRNNHLVKTDILSVGFTNASKSQILEYVIEKIQNPNSKIQIVTPNPEIIVYAKKHPAFQQLINQAQISLPDGVGITLAASILGKPLEERMTGVDFMESLCQIRAQRPITVGFLGAKPGVALAVSERLKEKYPGLNVSFAASELPSKHVIPSEQSESRNLSRMRVFKPVERSFANAQDDNLPNTKYQIPNTDILFVAFGFPKQEEWIAQHLPDIPVKVAMGVGGAFDYISGAIPRAPFFIRSIGLEWLYRLIRQPWRIKRQLALAEFIYLVIKEKMRKV